MNLGNFLFFNAICDMLDNLMTAEPKAANQPMPTKVKIAGVITALCLIATIIIIAYSF